MKAVVAFLVTVVAMLLISVLLAWPVELLWDWLVPELAPQSGLKQDISLLQAWGLTILCNLLFSSRVTVRRED